MTICEKPRNSSVTECAAIKFCQSNWSLNAMKFRAKMLDVLYMREFQAIAATLAKLAKDCVMIVAQERMHFIVNEEHCSTSSPLVWVSIASKDYFPEYQMTPARPEQEFIVLVMSAMHLSRSLAVLRSGSSSSVHSCKLNLKQIQFPCISVIASVVSPNSSEPREVVHDVPVTVIPASDWPSFMLPKVPNTQIVLGVPSLRLLRSLIDKLKNISPSLIFHGSTAGELNLVAESEMATITTRFSRLLLHKPDQGQSGAGAETSEPEISCSVDTRKASAFFNALQLPNEEIMIGIDSERCICLQLDIRSNVVLHSILPAVCV
ncbi:PREDICTED: checkpoint protein HUS1 [Drosophila arizonae]|uniref:Checkpoint protein n=1 Tax=Drosophila arizonae TaxID=7263 RepID=A0ABM1Q292_DROAR|nr:PREDICTED: checkpoint protein HUS1 [Drosophila arizonae]